MRSKIHGRSRLQVWTLVQLRIDSILGINWLRIDSGFGVESNFGVQSGLLVPDWISSPKHEESVIIGDDRADFDLCDDVVG